MMRVLRCFCGNKRGHIARDCFSKKVKDRYLNKDVNKCLILMTIVWTQIRIKSIHLQKTSVDLR